MSIPASPGGTCLPTTAWFLYDESGAPLGQVYRREAPEVGTQIEPGVVLEIQELRPTCANRRFRVVVRVGA